MAEATSGQVQEGRTPIMEAADRIMRPGSPHPPDCRIDKITLFAFSKVVKYEGQNMRTRHPPVSRQVTCQIPPGEHGVGSLTFGRFDLRFALVIAFGQNALGLFMICQWVDLPAFQYRPSSIQQCF
jgi:hypothetical protein